MLQDLQKYKRIFSFGCSFTHYIYPTYANVLAAECNQATFYNLGKAGGGNSLIAWRLAEANQRFKFTADDLVTVMYTSFSREDRYIGTKWATHGNVYNNDFFDESFLKKYTDPNGYLIQNCATIALTNGYLKNLPCDTLILNGYPFFYNEWKELLDEHYIRNLKITYKDTFEGIPISLFEYLFPDMKSNTFHLKGLTYLREDGTMFKDAHPNPLSGYDYLKNCLGLPLTNIALDYAIYETEELKKCHTMQDIKNRYHEYNEQNFEKIKDMFF